jgi:hypothetical protein
MKDSKNQMIRSMKSFQTGGSSDDACMEEYTGADGKRRKRRKKNCGYAKSQRVNKRRAAMNNFGEGAGKVLGTILGLGAAAGAGYGLKKLSEQKKGGSVKRTTKKK